VLIGLYLTNDQKEYEQNARAPFLMYRKLRDPYAAVLLCFVTDMDQIGGRKGLSVPAFLYFRGL